MGNRATAAAPRVEEAFLYRKRFESLVETSIQGIIVHRDKQIVFANGMLARIFGFRNASALLGTSPTELIHPSERERVLHYGDLRVAGKAAPEQYEFLGNHRSGKPIWLEARVAIVDWDGAPAWLVTLVDITERKLAGQQLTDSEERFRNLVEGSLEGVNVLQGQKLVFVNQAFADMFGYRNPAHVLRRPIWDRFQAPWERKRMARNAKNRVAGRAAPPRYEFQGVRRDGKVIWLEASVRRIMWQGKPALQGTLIDITERKRAQEELAASRELLRTVVDTVPHAIFAKDTKGRYLLGNRGMANFHSVEPEDLIGRTDAGLPTATQSQLAFFRRTDRHVLKTGKPLHLSDVELTDGAGNSSWRIIHKLPLRDAAGAVVGVVGVSQDVTAMRSAEAEIQAQRRNLEIVLNTLPYPVSFKDEQRRLQVVNKAFLKTWNLPASEMIGKRIDQVAGLGKKLNAEIIRQDLAVLRTGRRMDMVGVPIRTHTRDVVRHLIKIPVKDAKGRVTGVLTISEDITARRKAEEALIASKHTLEQILANIPVGLSLVDKDLNLVAANAGFFELLGFPKSMQGPRPFSEFVRYNAQRGEYGPGDVETLVTERVALAKKFQPHVFERTRPRGPALEIRGNPIPGGGFITTYMDITDRRRAQEQLVASERLLQTVLDSLPHWLTVKDSAGRYKVVNKSFAAFWQQPREAFIGRKPRELEFLPRPYVDAIDSSDRILMRDGTIMDGISRELEFNGKPTYQRLIKLPVRGDEGRIEGVVALIEDITAQRKADEDLRASRRLLQMVFDVIPNNLFVKDKDFRFVMANRAQCAFFGLTQEQFVGLPTEQLPGMYPELLERTLAYDRQVLEQGMVAPVDEYERMNASGSIRWLRGVKLPLLDDDGKVIGLLGMGEDITEAKRAEEALLESRRLLRTVIDAIPVNLFVKDVEGRFVLVNRSQASLYGVAPETMIGKTAGAMSGRRPTDLEAIEAWDRRVLARGEGEEIAEMTRTDHMGSVRFLRGVKLPLRDAQGQLSGLIGMTQDITEQRQAAQELWASRELLRTVFNTIPLYLSVKDRQSRFMMVNNAGARFEGLAPEAFVNLPTEQLPHRTAEQIQDIIDIDQRVLRGGEVVSVGEYTRVSHDGEQRWLRGVKLPLRDEQGHITGLLGVVEDITAHKAALEQLEASRRMLQTVFDALPLRVSVRDAEGRYVMVNRRIAEDHGRPAEVFIGQQLWREKGFSEAEREYVISRVRAAIETRKPVITPEMPLMFPGQNRRLVRSTLVPLFDAQGGVQGVLGIGEDITERRKSEQALLQAQKLESLGVLAGGIAHDFNNLLVTVMGNASLALLKLPPDAGPVEELKQIEIAGQRAADLCRQMLSYAGKGRLEKQPVNFNQVVQEMTQLLRVSLPKSAAVNFRLMPNLPLAEADPTQLRQVIMNLVINAGEAIGEQAGTIGIATGVLHADKDYFAEAQIDQDAPEGDYVFLEVTDTGVGMDAQTRVRIFDPFFTTKFTGRGLGLASVLGIVRGHGGGLKVYSEPGQGTSFKVLLPIALGAVVRTAAPAATDNWSGGGTVLVVDDEESIRSVASRMLNRLGFQVIEAGDGAAAVDILRNPPTPLTAALLDLTMPGLSGEETLRQLRRFDKRLPVILMSGYNQSEVLDRFVGRDLAGFLQKPFKLDDLRDKLRELFQESAGTGTTPSA